MSNYFNRDNQPWSRPQEQELAYQNSNAIQFDGVEHNEEEDSEDVEDLEDLEDLPIAAVKPHKRRRRNPPTTTAIISYSSKGPPVTVIFEHPVSYPQVSPGRYSCQFRDPCLKTFDCPGSVDRHIKNIHLNIKQYECEVCHHAFSDRRRRDSHIMNMNPRYKLCREAYDAGLILSWKQLLERKKASDGLSSPPDPSGTSHQNMESMHNKSIIPENQLPSFAFGNPSGPGVGTGMPSSADQDASRQWYSPGTKKLLSSGNPPAAGTLPPRVPGSLGVLPTGPNLPSAVPLSTAHHGPNHGLDPRHSLGFDPRSAVPLSTAHHGPNHGLNPRSAVPLSTAHHGPNHGLDPRHSLRFDPRSAVPSSTAHHGPNHGLDPRHSLRLDPRSAVPLSTAHHGPNHGLDPRHSLGFDPQVRTTITPLSKESIVADDNVSWEIPPDNETFWRSFWKELSHDHERGADGRILQPTTKPAADTDLISRGVALRSPDLTDQHSSDHNDFADVIPFTDEEFFEFLKNPGF